MAKASRLRTMSARISDCSPAGNSENTSASVHRHRSGGPQSKPNAFSPLGGSVAAHSKSPSSVSFSPAVRRMRATSFRSSPLKPGRGARHWIFRRFAQGMAQPLTPYSRTSCLVGQQRNCVFIGSAYRCGFARTVPGVDRVTASPNTSRIRWHGQSRWK